MTLTKRQRHVLNFIVRFIGENGYSPSLEEIAAGVGCSSLATVHKHLTNLQAKGAIARRPNRGRSVEPLHADTGFSRRRPAVVDVPLLGEVAAGRPIEAVAESEEIGIPASLVRGPDTFALRVRGNSMIDEQIRDGDIILVERVETAANGETVVALIDGTDVTVKKWHAQPDGRVRLEPANAGLQPLILPGDRVRIHGRVIGLLRKY